MKKQTNDQAVQAAISQTDQNMDPGGVEALAGISALGIIALLVGLACWSSRQFFGNPSNRRKKPVVEEDPIETSKIPLYQESRPPPHYPIMPPK